MFVCPASTGLAVLRRDACKIPSLVSDAVRSRTLPNRDMFDKVSLEMVANGLAIPPKDAMKAVT